MDLEFLKGLKLTDEKNKNAVPPQSHAQATTATSELPKHENLFDKLSSTFSGEKPLPPVVAAPPPEPEHHGILDKISHAVGGGSDPQLPPPVVAAEPKEEGFLAKASHLFGGETEIVAPSPPVAPAPAVEPKHGHLLDKISGALGGHEPAQLPPPPPPEHKNVFEKIGDAFTGEKETPPPPPPPKPEGISDKLHAALHGHEQKTESDQHEAGKDKKDIFDKLGLGHQPEPVPPKEESLLDKIGSTFHHEPPREPTFGEKLGSTLGLGKTEQQEDHLDKTIDFVQEHVLRQGTQDNESQFERWKDDRIANAIRSQYESATGHEFPHKEEKKK
ncbi:hypothetical protein V5O48_004327 [Marasmius crinis-equi]|uniref:WH2 domain-containing protein n=1 Tax=Marasmius crinis-equi TaxID=585013 RepID=A0ABR3FQG7_9AGAR